MISLLVAAVASLLVTLAPPAAHAASPWHVPPFHGDPFDGVVTFGDSLSDPGNAFVATRDFVVPPFDPIPDAPYAIGGFHFSNGRTWIEYLTRDLGLPQSGKPALRVPGLFTNYAQGAGGGIAGARARPVGSVNLGTEITLFLDDFKDSDPDDLSDMLYVIWIGSNDLRDALAAFQTDPSESEDIIEAALQATGDGIIRLWAAGASSFLVLNLPNLAIIPAFNTQAPGVQLLAEFFSVQYNNGLAGVLDDLENNLGITIALMDVFQILNDAVADPASVGLINVTDSCITPGVIIGAICRRPNTYLFWDFIHPTTKAHRVLAEKAEAALVDTFDGFASVAEVARPGGAMLSSR